MPVVILIRRVARADRLEAFQARWRAERPDHPGFIAEYLTRVDARPELPEGLRSLGLASEAGVAFVNLAIWRSAEDFDAHFAPKTTHDPELEAEPRRRMVLDLQEGVGLLSPESLSPEILSPEILSSETLSD